MKFLKIIQKSSIVCSFFVLLSSCNRPASPAEFYEMSGNVFGTGYTIKYQGEKMSQKAVDSLFSVFNNQFSTYQKETQLACYNTSNSNACFTEEGQTRFQYLVQLSEEVNNRSGGAFDPTAAVLFEAWGFGRNKVNQLPSQREIDSLMAVVGWSKVSTGEKHTLNFNAVAKGYAVDILCQFLEEKGIRNYFAEIGGEVRCKGMNPDEEIWRVGINKPSSDSRANELVEIVELNDAAMATSGNYRQFFLDENGNPLGHTIDPRIGRPVMNELLSATILANDCATADAYATACMVLGLQNSITLVEENQNLRALFVVQGKDSSFNVIKVGEVKTLLK
jgi:thiamine biosynthesis lipoprotein